MLALMLALSITPSVFAAEKPEWDISRSKVATALNENNESTVTLSLPSAEENLNSDVVFVLDGSSSAEKAVVQDSLKLLNELKTATENSGAAVNVCVVKFKRQAFKSDWYNLSNNYDAIKNAMETTYSGGTNIHAGLLAGKEALDQQDGVSADRKYLILISDGSTYLYSKDGNWASDTPFTRSYRPKEPYDGFAGGYWDNGWYEPNNQKGNVPRPQDTSDVATWHNYLMDVKARNETVNSEGKTGDDYDYHCNYDLNFNPANPQPSPDFKTQPNEPRTASNRDMAFYYANEAWNTIKDSGYHAYSIAVKDGSAGAGNADDSHCFMNYLNDGASLNFDDIKKEIIYAVGAGSQVEDKMGSEFDLVPGTFQLTVGGRALTCVQNGNTYSFGDDVKSDRFVINYNEVDDSFTWTINENVSNFAPVQLSYKVKLTNSSTTPGTYEVPTNEYARLTPKDSNGVVGQTVEFDIPKVIYTISEQSLSYDANGGMGTMSAETGVAGKIVTVAQNEFTRNNYTFTGWNTQADGKGTAYKAGDSFTLTDKDTVLYAQWSKNSGSAGTGTKGTAKPSAGTGTKGTAKPTDSPKTGDNSNLALWFALLFVSGGAVTATTIYGRKNKRSVK
ncbi:MAG: InlB B-repeat-containing protein [Blautia massiliensis (ex Durand et al. 2017)]